MKFELEIEYLKLYCTLFRVYFEIGIYCSYNKHQILNLIYFLYLCFLYGLNAYDHKFYFKSYYDFLLHY